MMSRPTSNERGAALVLAIGVLAVLIIISLTFWQSTRQEMQTATNTANSIRAELLTDGAFAIAIAFLNHDLAAHPSYTSLDHAWRTYFNGAWAAGKPWLWADIRNEQNSGVIEPIALFSNSGIKEDLSTQPPIIGTLPNHFDPETRRPVPGIPEIPPLVDGLVAGFTMDRVDANYFGDNIYIPRIIPNPNAGVLEQDTNDVDDDGDTEEFLLATLAASFVTSSDLAGAPLASSAVMDAHVIFPLDDNVFRTFSNGSLPLRLGTNDTLPAEQIHFWTDVDNDDDGLNDSMWLPVGGDVIFDADGLDNDLDGFIDEPGETAIFLYDGTADGLDNDGVNGPDDSGERFVFLTTRIFNLIDGNVNDLLDPSRINNFAISPDRRTELGLNPIALPGNILDAVDVIDNNFDLMVNGAETFVVRPLDLDNNHRALGYHQIAPRYLLDDTNFVSSAGETVSEIVGRIAILITDEASKVNINAAGGLSYEVLPAEDDGQFPLTRAMNSGVSPNEYELRVLPRIGSALSNKLWTLRMGGNGGNALSTAPYVGDLQPDGPIFADTGNFGYDVSLPGYGRVDDDGNLLALALNGIDDDGDGLIDEGINPAIPELLGVDFEGMDEPGEYQRFRPLRNAVAENDSDTTETFDGDFDGILNNTDNNDSDNDSDGVFDEIGELGDRFYRTHEQIKLVNQIGAGTFNDLHNFITAHSQDRNERHLHRDVLGDFSDDRRRRSTGPKLDYNIARAEEIANALRNDWRYPHSEPLTVNAAAGIGPESERFADEVRAYGLGLRREDTTVLTRDRLLDQGTVLDGTLIFAAEASPADASLRAMQLGVSIKDFADRDFARSELTSKVPDDWLAAAGNPKRLDLSIPANLNSLTDAQRAAQGQLISYTVAGIESIRINEIMVRPVRRFEAEAITAVNDPVFSLGPTDPDFVDFTFQPALNPNRFTPIQDFIPLNPALSDLPLPDFRMRVRTTADRLGDFTLDSGQPIFRPTAQEALDIIAQVGEQFPSFPTWFRSIPGATAPPLPFATPGLPLMGLASAYTTYQSYISVTTTLANDNRVFNVPDVVQFSFHATDGLPAGRYYLKVNTEFINTVTGAVEPSATREDDLSFRFKLGTLDNDILNDIIRDWEEPIISPTGQVLFVNRGLDVLFDAEWRAPAIVGSPLLGGSTGTAFLQADNVYRSFEVPVNGSLVDVVGVDPSFGAASGFTIEVPGDGHDGINNDGDENIDEPDEDLWLHVAVRSTRGDGRALVLNHFDFSQEPDHEWVELVNVDTDTAVDVSGWELAVEGGDRLVMTIPQNTFIAPGGMLLLGTNKFDEFTNPLIDFRGPLFENGIGLARGVFEGETAYRHVTVPPTFTVIGSVFNRADGLDFVDRNGDGLADVGGLDNAIQSTVNPPETFLGQGLNPETKAWDRIVELEVSELKDRNPSLVDTPEAAAVGAIVLAGGIFPNRPEYDGIDNDRDNLILSTDHIDNDGDGFFDEFLIDPDNNPLTNDDFPLEGIDEGRFRRDLFNQITWPVPGAFNQFSPVFDFGFGLIRRYAHPDTTVESPRWKEFIERRNFPGDNVIITLYEGPAFRNRVVDRVTYNQRDVENSAIDDVIPTNDFFDGEGNPGFDGFADIDPNTSEPFFGVPRPLDENYTSFWPGNTMGVDFYRSLERKHPLYSGDRFGTQNRFTATDGNYDDWADSTGRWERVLTFSPTGTELPLEVSELLDRFDVANGVYDQFAHAFNGSPLRMNATQRYAQEVLASDPVIASLQVARKAMFEEADARNRNIVSAGDLLTLAHISKTNPLVTLQQFFDEDLGDRAFLFDVDSPNVSFQGDRENFSYDQALLGQSFVQNFADPQNFFQDIRAVIGNAAANSSLALSVGQAEVFQLAPAITTWGTTDSGIPEAWVPVLLHEVDGDDPNDFVFGTFQHRYLMQTPSTLPLSVGTDRWPAESREAFYVSGNNQGIGAALSFDPTEFHIDGKGAESLFVWDGDDGLENGEYVLYLVMGDDLRTLLRAHNIAFNSFGTRLLTDGNFINDSGDADAFFGVDFVEKAIQTTPEERIIDVEVFTDRNGDRRVWTDIGGDGVQTGDLNRGFGGRPIETFGLEAGLEADASGVIRYGVVRVENNYLAVMLRNWSDAGNFNIFSRVVLAPRDKTPGRININTVQTRRTNNFGDLRDYFNPLVGLPGILERFADSANIDPSDRRLALPLGLLDVQTFFYAGTNQAQDLARHIVERRQRSTFEAPDGRYYELTSDLLDDKHGLPSLFLRPPPLGPSRLLQPPLVIVDHEEEVAPGVFDQVSNLINIDENNRAAAFIESKFRFSRMQNLITTRSDVFEIIVTVQAGYGTDTNGDGRINYRDDREFTATAEKSARTVYER